MTNTINPKKKSMGLGRGLSALLENADTDQNQTNQEKALDRKSVV